MSIVMEADEGEGGSGQTKFLASMLSLPMAQTGLGKSLRVSRSPDWMTWLRASVTTSMTLTPDDKLTAGKSRRKITYTLPDLKYIEQK